MLEKIEFRSLLKSFRVRKGPAWKQPNTAEELGVSRRLYVGWENGESIPSQRNLKKIATTFNLNKEDEEALYRAAAQAPPRIHNLPFPQNPFFTGRKTHLERLGRLLQETGTVEVTQSVGISGLGGIGKTQLALEYAHRHYPKVYLTVLWVNAADSTTLQASYDSLTQILELSERNEREPDRRIQAVKRWLEGHTGWLLIMDNAENPQLARSFLPIKLLGHVVLTTRSQIVRDSNIAVQIKVEEMEPEEGVLLLLRRAGILQEEAEVDAVASDIRETALQLVALLGGHPLALDQAGAYIEETGISLADYIQLYQEERRSLLDKRGPPGDTSDHPETVAATVELSFRKACERHLMAADVLHFCSFLQPDAMPEEVFYQDGDLKLTIKSFNEVMAALRRYSLIKRNAQEKILSMHRLVQGVLSDGMSPDLRKQWRERVMRAVNVAFPEVDFKDWKQCGRLLPHALVCATWIEHELAPTLEVSALLHKAGVYLRERGQYSDAESLLMRALSIREQSPETDHLDTAKSTHNLAVLYWWEGKYEQAERLYQRALSIYEQHLGAMHPDVASVLNDMAVLYSTQGKYEQAERLHQRALSIRKKCLGPEHPDTARSMHNLAALYYNQGKYDLAELLYQQTIAIRKKHLGTEHPETAVSLSSLAVLYLRQGKYGLAEPLFKQSLTIREKHLGAEHPDTARSLYNLAVLYWRQGNYEQAEIFYERARALQERLLGTDHPAIAHLLHGLAKALQDQGKYERVAALYQRALSIQKQRLGPNHPHTQETKRDYAAFLRSLGRDAEAAALT